MAHGVLAGHGQRAAGQIDHEAAPVWAFRAQGHGDAAAARTQIRKAGGAVAAFEGRFDEVLGFRAGNEGGGRDPEVPAVEFALAEKVGGGFAIGPAAEQAGHAGKLIAGEEGFRTGGEFHTDDAADVLEDEFGGQARRVHRGLMQRTGRFADPVGSGKFRHG